MASIQVDSQFNDKQKAAIEKATQEAQNILANNDSAKDAQPHLLVKVAGAMKNSQHRPIRLMKTHDAKGKFVTNPPGTIGGEASGAFVHEGATSQGQLPVVVGSKCALIYGTFDKSFPALGYLLAWDMPEISLGSELKVFVLAGDPYKLEKMEWSEIERRLNASGNKSTSIDHEIGAIATAEIKHTHNTNMRSLVAASFDRFEPKA
ncbi:uncharacterized protein LOC110707514 [Chenopodium quinoa]|uniref:Uncharacterized protein n=1 Tax=Chenopodium quinoa TaxID=63459 RepID=A0A803MM74_CHEQI|nr:uncharacterized protein LOC110707514 [Chenopodium quinoa]